MQSVLAKNILFKTEYLVTHVQSSSKQFIITKIIEDWILTLSGQTRTQSLYRSYRYVSAMGN